MYLYPNLLGGPYLFTLVPTPHHWSLPYFIIFYVFINRLNSLKILLKFYSFSSIFSSKKTIFGLAVVVELIYLFIRIGPLHINWSPPHQCCRGASSFGKWLDTVSHGSCHLSRAVPSRRNHFPGEINVLRVRNRLQRIQSRIKR